MTAKITDVARRFTYEEDDGHSADVAVFTANGLVNIDCHYGRINIRESMVEAKDIRGAGQFLIGLASFIESINEQNH